MLNKTMVQGRLVADPEMRTTPSGVAVCSFRVAWSETYKEHEKKLFLACTAWRGLGEMIGKYFHKGKEIIVEGALETEEYTDKEGNKRSAVKLTVDKAHFCGPKDGSSSGGGYKSAGSGVNVSANEWGEVEDEEDLPF